MFTFIILVFSLVVQGCSGAVTSSATKYVPPPETHLADYLAVSLPEGWAAAEGDVSLVSTGHLSGEIAFNSWGEDGFWAYAATTTASGGGPGGSSYSPRTIMDQVPPGGVYIVLVRTVMPIFDPSSLPEEYTGSDLSGLYESHDWRLEKPYGVKKLNFFKWGRYLELAVCCRPDASDETVAQVNALLASWRFDEIPSGDIRWARSRAITLLPAAVHPEKFPFAETGGSRQGDYVTSATVENKTVHFRYTYYWDTSESYSQGLSDKYHWWEIDVLPDGKAVLTDEGGKVYNLAICDFILI